MLMEMPTDKLFSPSPRLGKEGKVQEGKEALISACSCRGP